MKNVPIIGKKYYYFDDGKIKISRRLEVIITDIIPFDEIDSEIFNLWNEDVQSCDWLYAKETDYFIKAYLKISDHIIENIIFVRNTDVDSGWFSIGWWGGRLDIDGSLNDNMLQLYNKILNK